MAENKTHEPLWIRLNGERDSCDRIVYTVVSSE